MRTYKLDWPEIKTKTYSMLSLNESSEVMINMYDYEGEELGFIGFYQTYLSNKKKVYLINFKDKYREFVKEKANISILEK